MSLQKASRDARDGVVRTVQIVSAWASEEGIALGQVATEAKSNEITAIPRLLEQIDLAGTLIAIDAMGCQKDIVEQIVAGTMQTEINEAIGLDFARAARHLLRQDPQVLILGEIRDEATAQLAVRAGLTGHLVISTLHAGSCKGVFR